MYVMSYGAVYVYMTAKRDLRCRDRTKYRHPIRENRYKCRRLFYAFLLHLHRRNFRIRRDKTKKTVFLLFCFLWYCNIPTRKQQEMTNRRLHTRILHLTPRKEIYKSLHSFCWLIATIIHSKLFFLALSSFQYIFN